MTGRIHIVVGGQYGSEGKGAIAAHLTQPALFNDGLAIRVGGPNAGHTAIGTDGNKYAFRHLPVAAVTNPHAQLAIAAGSEIDPAVLAHEIALCEEAGYSVHDRLRIDPTATVITQHHRDVEHTVDLTARIGSTGKGIGAARADRIMRTAETVGQYWRLGDRLAGHDPTGMVDDVHSTVYRYLWAGRDVLIEGTQGYGLGLHTACYPQVTSGDCTAVDFLAQARISPWHPAIRDLTTWVVFRPNPIRVAGNSGPLRGETTWTELGLEEEKTTVTGKTRRVGAWDPDLVLSALRANGWDRPNVAFPSPVRTALTMADHILPQLAGRTAYTVEEDHRQHLHEVFEKMLDFYGIPRPDLIGTSPATVIDFR